MNVIRIAKTHFNLKEGAAANVRLNPQFSLRGVYHNGQEC